jgi:protein TonB
VSIIEEVKPPPPPPPPPTHIKLTPPPANVPPPPAYVPPPEVVVHAAPVENTVTATVQTPPPPPVVAAAPAPVVEAPKPKVADASVACPGYKEALGRLKSQADKQSWSGDILVELSVEPSGEIGNVQVLRSSNRMFNSAVVAAVAKIQCAAQGQAVKVDIPLIFRPE